MKIEVEISDDLEIQVPDDVVVYHNENGLFIAMKYNNFAEIVEQRVKHLESKRHIDTNNYNQGWFVCKNVILDNLNYIVDSMRCPIKQ